MPLINNRNGLSYSQESATAREMIDDGMCDMVSMARPLIADPQLSDKAREGQFSAPPARSPEKQFLISTGFRH